MTMRSWTITLLSIIGLPLLVGCHSPLNDRPTLGGTYRSPTFRVPEPSTSQNQAHPHGLFTSTPKPRSSWTPTQYIAPIDSVVHAREFVLSPPLKNDDPPRVYGRFPTTQDAIDSQSTSWFDDLFITIDELGRSFLGTPYAIGSLAITGHLTEPVVSPHHPWKRTTAQNWSSGFPSVPHPKEDPSDD